MHACNPLARANRGIWSCEQDRELPPADDLLAPVASSEATAQRPSVEFQTILKTQFMLFAFRVTSTPPKRKLNTFEFSSKVLIV